MAKILVIDDEQDMLVMIKRILEKDGYLVVTRDDVSKVLPADCQQVDLILLDVMMPGMDGFTFCQQIRETTDCPILFLTAKTLDEDMVMGFASGGDDYITKPFSASVLRARVTAHLRRETREKHYRMQVGDVSFNLVGKELFVHDAAVSLTKTEYEICAFLGQNSGQVFSKEQLYEKIYGFEGEGDSTTITERIKHIRQKFKPFGIDPITTVWGIGYKWVT